MLYREIIAVCSEIHTKHTVWAERGLVECLNCWRTRGVFKKRPKFLNSAPTSRESALRLLSARRVRFWQQTAICPVSLWALVVELHPLKWARAKAVRGFGDKVIMKELEQVKVSCRLAKHFTETFQLLNQAYREDWMVRTQCYEWFKPFNLLAPKLFF